MEQARPYGWELQGKALLCGRFFELLTRCREGFSGEGGEKVRSKEELARLDALLRRLQARYAEPLSLADLSREIGMSRENCCRFFKRMTGQTLSQYLETYRVSRAIALMQQGESVTSAAMRCGFANRDALRKPSAAECTAPRGNTSARSVRLYLFRLLWESLILPGRGRILTGYVKSFG